MDNAQLSSSLNIELTQDEPSTLYIEPIKYPLGLRRLDHGRINNIGGPLYFKYQIQGPRKSHERPSGSVVSDLAWETQNNMTTRLHARRKTWMLYLEMFDMPWAEDGFKKVPIGKYLRTLSLGNKLF